MNNLPDNNNLLKVYSNDDKKMQQIGQILGAEKSRKIYGILVEQKLNANEIGKIIDGKDNPRLPNLVFHLNKMVNCGMLTVEKRQQQKGGHVLKYYKAVPFILITPPHHTEKAKKSKTLFSSFKTVFKLAGVGIAGATAWVTSSLLLLKNNIQNPDSNLKDLPNESFLSGNYTAILSTIQSEDYLIPTVASAIVIACGIFLIIYSKK